MNRQRRTQSGVSVVGVLLLVALAGLVYAIVALGPAYYNNLEAKQAMREIANMSILEKSDARLQYELNKRLKRIGTYYEMRDGERVEVSPIVPEEDAIEIERDEEHAKIVIRMYYQREVTMPLFGQVVTLDFQPEIEGDTTAVKW